MKRLHFCPIRAFFNCLIHHVLDLECKSWRSVLIPCQKDKRILTNTVLDIWYYSDFILYAETRKPTPTTVAPVVRMSKRCKHRAPIR